MRPVENMYVAMKRFIFLGVGDNPRIGLLINMMLGSDLRLLGPEEWLLDCHEDHYPKLGHEGWR